MLRIPKTTSVSQRTCSIPMMKIRMPGRRSVWCRRSQEVAGGICQASGSGGEEVMEDNRRVQVEGSRQLMRLLEAEDLRKEARELAPHVSQDFFMVGTTYMEMAKSDKQLEVAGRIENALKVMMEEKNKTLRPEIRLLNDLIREKESVQRKRILNTKAAAETLQMNRGYFFVLLSELRTDVKDQPKHKSNDELLDQLYEIEIEALSRMSHIKGFGSID